MIRSLPSFWLGVVITTPLLPMAWGHGRANRPSRVIAVASCRCEESIRAASRLLAEVESAIRAATTAETPPKRTQDSPVASRESVPRSAPSDDLTVQASSLIDQCLSDFWQLSQDDSDGLRKAILTSGGTPFDDGARELIGRTQQRLQEVNAAWESERDAIRAGFPLAFQYWNAADKVPKELVREFRNQQSQYIKDNNVAAAKYEEEKQSVLDDLIRELSAR
jgi:hypothetical protein